MRFAGLDGRGRREIWAWIRRGAAVAMGVAPVKVAVFVAVLGDDWFGSYSVPDFALVLFVEFFFYWLPTVIVIVLAGLLGLRIGLPLYLRVLVAGLVLSAAALSVLLTVRAEYLAVEVIGQLVIAIFVTARTRGANDEPGGARSRS